VQIFDTLSWIARWSSESEMSNRPSEG